ncbi:PREDICTED: uncharacterized protein LOC106308805 [Brassica oleracea var. oleracea]|uniref:uncharacterized protein LOC106308805 n=1 Tax=Brassica oleracea var. oleracea TaxID=109376 RepID=UPI0006A74393|nr:PREDICTED: uncharacterized protein LOC106308805 [Brassica oleracea var. oleracea]
MSKLIPITLTSPPSRSTTTPPLATPTPTPTAGARRKIGVAVDLSEESSFAVRWAVDHYIRPGDAVVILHVSPTSVRERLCLEIERLGLSAVIMGSRGFGAEKRGSDGKLGSVSDYCVHHCVCPVVVVVRFPDDRDGCPAASAPGGTKEAIVTVKSGRDDDEDEAKIAAASAHHEHIKDE